MYFKIFVYVFRDFYMKKQPIVHYLLLVSWKIPKNSPIINNYQRAFNQKITLI